MIKQLSMLLLVAALSTNLYAEECKHSLTSTCLGLADKTQEAALGAIAATVDWIPAVNVQDYIKQETKNTKAFEYGEYLGAAVGIIGGFEGGKKFMFEAWELRLANKAKQLQSEAKQLAKEAEESRVRAEKLAEETKRLQELTAKSEAARNARNLDKLRLETDRLRLQQQKRDAGLVHSEGTTDSRLTKED